MPGPLDSARTCYAVHTAYGRTLAADIPDDRFAEVPFPGMNPPVWLLGHVAVVGNFALSLLAGLGLDAPAVDLPGWRENFGVGTEPLVYEDGFAPPSADALRAAVAATHDRFHALTAEVTPGDVRPEPVDDRADRRPVPDARRPPHAPADDPRRGALGPAERLAPGRGAARGVTVRRDQRERVVDRRRRRRAPVGRG